MRLGSAFGRTEHDRVLTVDHAPAAHCGASSWRLSQESDGPGVCYYVV